MKNIVEALRDPNLFGQIFPTSDSWCAWLAALRALFGLEMSEEERAVFSAHTGRETPPESAAKEAWFVVGRRGGKSRIAALVAVYLACFRDYSAVLAPGERGVVMCISQDRRQARVLLRYIEALFDIPMLKQMVKTQTREAIHLNNRISIEIHTCSFRAVRGYTIVAAVCDEIALWRDETSLNPDEEILAAIRPGMSTVRDPMLLCIGSPYARRGAMWNAYKKHFGQDGSVLVWQADTASMNPTISQAVIEKAYEDDPKVALAEYGAQFRKDIDTYIGREVAEACVVANRFELPFCKEHRYVGFCDPSGGKHDSFTVAIAHREGEAAVLDVVRERRAPFNPEVVVQEFSELLKSYQLTKVIGDKYAGEWPPEQFLKHGIVYEASEHTKSELYLEFLPAVNSGRVELLDHKRLLGQLMGLERRTSRSGKDSIDHERRENAFDDVINAVAGALLLAGKKVITTQAPMGPTSPSHWIAADGDYGPGY